MELHRTDEGFALYKEKTQIGFCALTPAAKGAAITAFGIEPQWRRKGYGSYLLKETLRAYAGYDREKATVFTAPLPADAAELAFWAKFGFAAEGRQLVRRRTPDLTAVKFVQDFLAARLAQPRLCIDATCGKKTKAVIVMENHMIVLSSLLPDTITNRLNNSYVTS